MLPRSTFQSTVTRGRRGLAGVLAGAIALTLGATLLSAPAYAANPVTPGNFTGLGFDQCEAPSQAAMSTWIKKSPFRAAGIYISGASRACQRQSNLSATWVSNQLAAGWHLMPITLGPQASCSTRYPRYGKNIDPTINASTTGTYSAARAQGALEARRAVQAARNLGIVPGSTLFYDLEAFNTSQSTACTWSALWFLSAWTQELHRYSYASGLYSSAASGIKMIDDARVRPGNQIAMPDQIWVADWNGRADTHSSYIRSDGWHPYARAHQYQGGHDETWGGVRINIDRNYLDLRTPRLPGTATPVPAPAPAGPRYTGTTLSDPKCTPATISRASYVTINPTMNTTLVVPLQCLLKQRLFYPYEVTGTWNAQTTAAVHAFQKRVGNTARSYVSRSDWVSLLVAGNGGRVLKRGDTGADVIRVQRALNAAGSPRLTVNGIYTRRTAKAVGAYQRRVHLARTRVVAAQTWGALGVGRR
ncbi:MAG: Peptidoglycan-binding domain 1 protein [Marmoricola sp.]|nr:Peptidoglycan-binding domain 1 protein [Marmoricola sp.]